MKPKQYSPESRYYKPKLHNLELNSSAPSLNPTQLLTMPARDLKDLDLAAINTAQGIKISGARSHYHTGFSVSSAGDVNGDGFDDVIIGAYQASDNYIGLSGTSYVLFGSAAGLNNIDLLNLSSADGFKIYGAALVDYSGWSVSSAGDINGDGYGDVIIGAYGAKPNGRSYAGISYVIYGKNTSFIDIDLASLSPIQGFKVLGAATNDYSGWSVSSAGDVNGDGYSDIIIGAIYADPNGRGGAGISYVIYGKNTNFSDIDLASLRLAQGFKILGAAVYDYSGWSVSSAGDVNGDGYCDIMIGAYADPNGRVDAGISYIIYGKNTSFSDIDLASLNLTQGFKILGAATYDYSGRSVSSAGDVNGDGYSDIIIGAIYADPNGRADAGISYIIYGKSTSFNDIDLILFNSTQGFRIFGAVSGDYSGCEVSSAGDVNGDGYDDIIIGAYAANPNGRADAGVSYVVYGKNTSFTDIDLISLSITQGFKIHGSAAYDYSGISVSSAGDINGDGYSDIIIGAYLADSMGRINNGEAYIIYNSGASNSPTLTPTFVPSVIPSISPTIMPTQPTITPSAVPSTPTFQPTSLLSLPSFSPTIKKDLPVRYLEDIDLAFLNANQGIEIAGARAHYQTGLSVSSAGDINGDGYADVIIGAYQASDNYIGLSGTSYVLFGSAARLNNIDLLNLSSADGFKIYGAAVYDQNGYSVSNAGDVNGDGCSDIIIGAVYADPNGRSNAGISYVIYGKSTNFSDIDLAFLSQVQGFKVLGALAGDNSGYSVSSAGDINGDGYDDIIIGALYADPNGRADAGISYIIYGKSTSLNDIDLATLNSIQGFKVLGAATGDNSGISVSSAGDVNGDGFDDVIIGAYLADINGRVDAGISYVIYGKNTSFSDIDLASLNPTQGFKILGAATYDYSGRSVSSARDVNGDGYSDIIIGAIYADPNGRVNAGASYVIYGKNTSFSDIDLAFFHFIQGFKILGAVANDYSGRSVSSAGDVNGDGYDDLIIGAIYADPNDRINAGISYVIYGKNTSFSDIELASLSITQGFKIHGSAAYDYSGISVSSVGDMNGDGYTDIIIGAYLAAPNSRNNAGAAYIIFNNALSDSPTSIPSLVPSTLPSSNPSSQPSSKPSALPTTYLENGLVAYYSFSGNANDETGNGNDGVVHNALLTEDRFGNTNSAYFFDGRTSYIEVIDEGAFNFSTEFSISLWIKPFISQNSYAGILDKGHLQGNHGWFLERLSNSINEFYFAYKYPGGWIGPNSVNFQLQSWNHLVIIKHSTEIYYYLNIQRAESSSTNSEIILNADHLPLMIGAQNGLATSPASGITRFFNGTLDDIRIYNRALSAEEVQQLYTYETPNPTAAPTMPIRQYSDIDLADLNPNQGIAIYGASSLDLTGSSVSGIGDFNGDGFADVIIGAYKSSPELRAYAGTSYVIFGKPGGFENIDLLNLSPSQGFKIFGAAIEDWSGYSVSGGGDINGDGFDDIIIGSPDADPYGMSNAGIVYVIFGKSSNYTNIDLTKLTINQGFMIYGALVNYNSGASVNEAGDVNGDGYGDIIIGAPSCIPWVSPCLREGQTYIIYGKANISDIDLSSLTVEEGIIIKGIDFRSGVSVSKAGDINGDNYGDVIIGADNRNGFNNRTGSGEAYVIYGGKSLTDINLLNLNISQGFTITGAHAFDYTGFSVSAAGDINNDNFDDIMIGAYKASPLGRDFAGIVYILFGSSSGYSNIDLAEFSNNIGFAVYGKASGDKTGIYVSGAGDINGDNYQDIILGSSPASTKAGVSYVIFGKLNSISNIDLTNLSITDGFEISGVSTGDNAGISVASAGDFNGDGYDDIIIGAPNADYLTRKDCGAAYIIYNSAASANPTSAPSGRPSVLPSSQPTGNPTSAPTTHLQNGLVAYYSFSGNANDESGNGNDGVVHGATLVADRFGNPNSAYSFDGISNIEIQNSTLLDIGTNNYSISAWINLDQISPSIMRIFHHGSYSCNSYPGYVFTIYNAKIFQEQTCISENCASYQIRSVSTFTTHTWYFVAASIQRNGNAKIYVNGNLESQVTNISACDISNGQNAFIGHNPIVPNSQNFYGNIDEVRVYNRVLTTNEILELYQFEAPTGQPTSLPSEIPSSKPTGVPTGLPSAEPTNIPTPTLSPTTDLENGLVAYYSFSGNANDESGNGNDGVVHNATLVADRFGNPNSAYSFDGSTSYIEVVDGTQFDFTNNMSVSVWIKPSSIQTRYGVIFDKSHYNGGDIGSWFFQQLISLNNRFSFDYITNTGLAYPFTTSDTSNSLQSTSYIWNFLTITKEDKSIKYYLNGVFLTSVTMSSSAIISNGNLPLVIGAQNSGGSSPASSLTQHFNGSMDDIGIYNRPLTPTEVLQLYQFENPTPQPSLAPSYAPSCVPTFIPSARPTLTARSVSDVDLATLNPNQGIKISGTAIGDKAGYSVANIGDFNGDGFDDVIIGAPEASPFSRAKAGEAYIIFGSNNSNLGVDLLNIDSSRGFKIFGASAGDECGYSVSSAGDFNNDGLSDVIIGARFADAPGRTYVGGAYIIYGKSSDTNDIDLTTLSSSQGFQILGAGGYLGWSVGSAGDVNNDGYLDVVIGAPKADPYGRTNAGITYVIFGNSSISSDIDTNSLNVPIMIGFRIFGSTAYDGSGYSVRGAGDIDQDGYDEIIIGARGVDANNETDIGAAYVIFGKETGFVDIDLANLNPIDGFIITGINPKDYAGSSVNAAGDVNGDGYPDILIGVVEADHE